MSRSGRDCSSLLPQLAHPPAEWGVCASASVKAPLRGAWRTSMARRAPAVVAVVLVLLGVIAVAVRFDAASDGTVVTSWRADGVVIDVPKAVDGPVLQTGDVVITIGVNVSPTGWAASRARHLGVRSRTRLCGTAPPR
jgi:hypothetical protein